MDIFSNSRYLYLSIEKRRPTALFIVSVAEPVSLSRFQPSPPLQTGDPHTVLKVFGLTSEISVEGESVTVSVLGAQAIDLGNFTLNVSDRKSVV